MFISALQTHIVVIIISAIAVQYAFALFCLTRLAYLDIERKNYVLWNLFILIVFFVGGAVFLIYYYRHPELRISKTKTVEDKNDAPSDDGQSIDPDKTE